LSTALKGVGRTQGQTEAGEDRIDHEQLVLVCLGASFQYFHDEVTIIGAGFGFMSPDGERATILLALLLFSPFIHGTPVAASQALQPNAHLTARSGAAQSTAHDGKERLRIIGGFQSSFTQIPWEARISRLGGTDILCSGQLISPRWLLTAAHCLLNSANNGYVGVTSLDSTRIMYNCVDMSSPDCKYVSAVRYIPHPCYTPSIEQDHDDIALIELDSDAIVPQYAKVDGLSGTLNVSAGNPCTLAGWGVVDNNKKIPAQLMQVEVTLASQQDCIAANPFSSMHQFIDFNHVVCTGGNAGKDSCNGDSGGPAIIFVGSTPWVIGVLSKGSELPSNNQDCGVQGRYGMYTLVSFYGGWIEGTIMGSSSVCSDCPCIGPGTFSYNPSGGAGDQSQGSSTGVVISFSVGLQQVPGYSDDMHISSVLRYDLMTTASLTSADLLKL